MAMHQHLNYFTKTSLSYILNSVGFEIISVDNAGYGGSIYAIGQKKNSLRINYSNKEDIQDYNNFVLKAKKTINNFKKVSENIFNDSNRSLGYYIPLRTLPYLSFLSHNDYRFFDDTTHWYNCVFDGSSVPIENFSDLIKSPTTDIVIMSLTFGDIIKKKLKENFGERIKITTLKDLMVNT